MSEVSGQVNNTDGALENPRKPRGLTPFSSALGRKRCLTPSPRGFPETPATTLVCFDLGRVLIDLADGWADAMAAAGSKWLDDPIDDATQVRMFDVLQRMERGEIDAAAFASDISKMIPLPAHEIQVGLGCYLRSPMKDIDALIDGLTPLPNVMTACLSNTNATHWAQMHEPGSPHYLGLDRLDFRFASHLIGRCKPDPAIYEYVEQTAGIEPERIIFFDDREENVLAACERGWQAKQIATDAPTVPQMAAHLQQSGIEINLSDEQSTQP